MNNQTVFEKNRVSPFPASPFRVELFGGLRLLLPDGSVVSRFRTQKTAALLAYLALHAGKTHSREHLLELFWPHLDGPNGRNNLSTTLTFLRRDLAEPTKTGASPLVADHRSVGFTACVQTDVAEWNRLISFALWRQPSPATFAVPTLIKNGAAMGRRDALETALLLYRGPFLPGFYDTWVCDEQNRFAEQYLTVLRVLIGLREQNHEWEAALDLARCGLRADPYSEDFCHAALRLCDVLNQPTAALQLFGQWEKRLRTETIAAPSVHLTTLVGQIKSHTF